MITIPILHIRTQARAANASAPGRPARERQPGREGGSLTSADAVHRLP